MRYQSVSADELFAAMRLGGESIVRQLVLRDARVASSRDETGVSAILRCLYDWNLGMLEILLAAGPRLDIFEAAALGKTGRLEELLLCMPELAGAWSPDGVTALHLACFYGQEEAVEHLLEAGADPLAQTRNEAGTTPLEEATTTGQSNIVRLLMAYAEAGVPNKPGGWAGQHMAASQAE
jgi:uncharacterized protein